MCYHTGMKKKPLARRQWGNIPPEKQMGRDRTRNLVRIRDNFTCQDCGERRTFEDVQSHNSRLPTLKGRIKSFDVHHLNGLCGKKTRAYDSVKDIDTMITLCHKCHYNRPEHKVNNKSY